MIAKRYTTADASEAARRGYDGTAKADGFIGEQIIARAVWLMRRDIRQSNDRARSRINYRLMAK